MSLRLDTIRPVSKKKSYKNLVLLKAKRIRLANRRNLLMATHTVQFEDCINTISLDVNVEEE